MKAIFKKSLLGYAIILVLWFLSVEILGFFILGIPIGLAGKFFPILFTLPVLIALFVYELIISQLVEKQVINKKHIRVWTLIIPVSATIIILLYLLPTETGNVLLIDFWNIIVGR